MGILVKDRSTRIVRWRYDTFAPVYDYLMRAVEGKSFKHWRSLLWEKVEGKEVLEVGVGTGLNFFYADTANHNVTAIDLSEGMLKHARAKAASMGLKVTLLQMDVQDLQFPDDSFDTVIGSFLFCSVPDPLLGLREARRVCRPGGKVILLEHGLSENRILAWFMNLADPLVSWVTGAEHINRVIEKLVVKSGLQLENVARFDRTGVFKLIEARKQNR